jgi:hypothetical protein
LNYYEAMETYSRIGLLRNYENLQSYWTTTKLWKLTVVLDYYEAIETYSPIQLEEALYVSEQIHWDPLDFPGEQNLLPSLRFIFFLFIYIRFIFCTS